VLHDRLDFHVRKQKINHVTLLSFKKNHVTLPSNSFTSSVTKLTKKASGYNTLDNILQSKRANTDLWGIYALVKLDNSIYFIFS
jgi:hypothetical protein